MRLDDKSISILNELVADARQSYRAIAQKLGISTATVMQRVNSMEEQRLIRRYSTLIDYDKAGFDVQVVVEMRISKGKLLDVEKKIARHPNVSAVYDTTGDFDVLIIAKFRNRRAMDNFLKQIQSYDFVERTNTKLILNIIKEEEVKV